MLPSSNGTRDQASLLKAYWGRAMKKFLMFVGIVGAPVISYLAYDVYACQSRAAEYKVESIYDLRKGCLFKTADGYSSVFYKTNPK